MLGSDPPALARQVGQPQPKPPSRHGDQGGGGGGWANGLPCHPPPPAKQFSSRPVASTLCVCVWVCVCVLQCMIEEIPMAFQVLWIQDVAAWHAWIDGLQLTALAELHCKEHFY